MLTWKKSQKVIVTHSAPASPFNKLNLESPQSVFHVTLLHSRSTSVNSDRLNFRCE